MSPTTGNEVFLAACIKYAKDKVVVDFEALSKELGISKGGAANKFRTIMKQLEEDGAAWAKKSDNAEPNTPAATGTKRKATAKKIPHMAKTTVESEGGNMSEDTEIEPPKKKARGRATKKNAAKLAGDAENDAEVDAAATTTGKKKSKGKVVKKTESAMDEANWGDDEVSPGCSGPKAAIKDVSTAKMVEAAVAISKTDTVPSEDDN